MNEFTRDIGATLINMLWYLSNYPDFYDYGQTTRRDFIESAIEKIEPHLSEHKEEIEQIFKEFKDGFKIILILNEQRSLQMTFSE